MFCHKLLLGRGERGNYFISGARLRLIIRRKERLLMTERVYSIRQPARGYRYLDADGRLVFGIFASIAEFEKQLITAQSPAWLLPGVVARALEGHASKWMLPRFTASARKVSVGMTLPCKLESPARLAASQPSRETSRLQRASSNAVRSEVGKELPSHDKASGGLL